ncbi:MAG TPA: hypothetical protein DDY37_07630 [Legionella sp.]|nr:hypothetical protein [Legionella sp.]
MRFSIKKYILVVLFSCFPMEPLLASSAQYAVIVDAGSSGSRAHVFEYTTSLPVPAIKDIFSQSSTPGLSSYANTPAAAGASLKPVLDAAAQALQDQGVNLSQVPVSVLATAGMRLLPPAQQDAIYASVSSYIQNHYAFSLSPQNIGTISGTMEGVYGWLDVNYLLHHFDNPGATTTVGHIDMGGASTQIAFATTDTSKPNNEVVVTIDHTPYRVFSQSFLGLGLNEARDTMAASAGAASCFPEGYPSGSDTGMFNFMPCSDIYAGMIQRFDVTQHLLPTAGVSFIASSGAYYTYRFFHVLQTPSQSALESQINGNCYLPWSQLQKNFPSESSAFLSSYCANATYLDHLLYTTYQLQASQLRVANELNGTGIDWTLGALLYRLVQEEPT